MSTRIKSITVRGDRVTLQLEWTGYRGHIDRRQQITVSRHEFERALDGTVVEIPWRGLI